MEHQIHKSQVVSHFKLLILLARQSYTLNYASWAEIQLCKYLATCTLHSLRHLKHSGVQFPKRLEDGTEDLQEDPCSSGMAAGGQAGYSQYLYT